jgi:hypothetical protein
MTGHRKWATGLVAATALVLIAAGETRADLVVSYSTSGTFSDSGTNTIELGTDKGPTIDISFTGTSQSNLGLGVSDPTVALFGTFTAMAVATGSANRPASGGFNLTLTQSAPTVDSHTFTATLSGSIKLGTSKDVTITFASPLSTTFGIIKYTLPSSVLLASPGNTKGATTSANLMANIIDPPPPVSAPEPSTLVLAGIGVLMLGGYSWRRRRGVA